MMKSSWELSIVVFALSWITFPANGAFSPPDPATDCEMPAYDAKKDLAVISERYEMVMETINENGNKDTIEKQLEKESCNGDLPDVTKLMMCKYFRLSYENCKRKKNLVYLTIAECTALLMYTTGDKVAFYSVYRKALAKGDLKSYTDYKVYTTLLFSAIKTLSDKPEHRVESTDTLYRGIPGECKLPTSPRIFWKTFISTSLDEKVARRFAENTGTILVFDGPATRFGAKLGQFSVHTEEEEVLISPFEAFDVSRDVMFKFPSSDTQKLLMFKFTSSDTQKLLDTPNTASSSSSSSFEGYQKKEL